MNQKIPDKLFFKIGEVAKLTGVEQHVLRYWEDEFDALQPKKNKSGQRLYEKKNVELIFKIQKLLYLERYTIVGAKQKIRESKRKNSQLSLGFDRESFLDQKRDIISDLEMKCKGDDSNAIREKIDLLNKTTVSFADQIMDNVLKSALENKKLSEALKD